MIKNHGKIKATVIRYMKGFLNHLYTRTHSVINSDPTVMNLKWLLQDRSTRIYIFNLRDTLILSLSSILLTLISIPRDSINDKLGNTLQIEFVITNHVACTLWLCLMLDAHYLNILKLSITCECMNVFKRLFL